ncbi:DUF1731 domain-containing protein [Nocardia camponoti]|uniref:Nucleoside-diphosphate sugar epimerase n=1 Tax=Nocardia camponoti TaxID=1616106 RepID=A0A917V8G5_9NOCA|nr:DUF1731 domain-containing protein [Nocardia camponoti]GGK49501.1 nucleoside-diphosphate sugar epimerase [Nocardia camponoti]
MAGTTKYTQFIALPPESVWPVLADLTRLPEWNPGVTSVRMHSPVALGAKGDYLPNDTITSKIHARLADSFTVTAFTPNYELAIAAPEPAGAMTLAWRLVARDGGTELSQELRFSGPSAGVARQVVAKYFEAGARVAFSRLARLAGLVPANDALSVVVAGGSGALGQQVAADLVCRGQRVTLLTRGVNAKVPFRQVLWDGRSVGAWASELREPGRIAVINLAGKLVDCRPTERNIAELRSSRVDSTAALVAAARERATPVDYWIQASTTAIWSDAGETRCTESTPLPVGDAALPQMTGVAAPWEEAFDPSVAKHSTVLRTSIVLDPESPALRRLVGLTKGGLGGRVGPGDQWFSWIHLDDWLAIVRAALGLDPEVSLPDGILVAATDFPVRNTELMATLRRLLHRPPALPTPKALLKVGAVALRTDAALGLTGRHATSEVLPNAGFTFKYPTLDEALTDLLPH